MSQKSQELGNYEDKLIQNFTAFLKAENQKNNIFSSKMESQLLAIDEICQETSDMKNYEEERCAKQKILNDFLIKKVKELGKVQLSQTCSQNGSQNIS